MSVMTMEAVVKAVEPRDITVQGQPRKVYDVVDQSGTKWTAWERELAERAYNLKDQPSIWKIESKQNGQYTNRSLKDIVAKGSSSMDQALSSGFPEDVKPAEASFDQPGATITPKDTFIFRQVAVKAVAVLAGAGGMTPDEFWANVVSIVRYCETGQVPGQVHQVPQESIPDADPFGEVPF